MTACRKGAYPVRAKSACATPPFDVIFEPCQSVSTTSSFAHLPYLFILGSRRLAVGSPLGAIKDLFARVKVIHDKHGPFAFVLCVGDFFGPQENEDIAELLAGTLAPPLPVYVMHGEHTFPPAVLQALAESTDGTASICPNVTVIAKVSTVTAPGNVRIVACGGKFDATGYKSEAEVRLLF